MPFVYLYKKTLPNSKKTSIMFIQELFLNITITFLFGHLIFISKSFALQNSPLEHLKLLITYWITIAPIIY